MKQLYKQLSFGMSKDEALRQAKLTYLELTSGIAGHPVYWSPFIQLGEQRAIELSTKKGTYNRFIINNITYIRKYHL